MTTGSHVTTSVTVSFDEGSRSLVLQKDDSRGLEQSNDYSYAKVYPSLAHPAVSAVYGLSLARVAANVPDVIEEWLVFTEANSASLRLPGIVAVSILEARFFKLPAGVTVNPVFDVPTQQLRTPIKVTGAVKVRYVAYFDRYRCYHDGNVCNIVPKDQLGDTSKDPIFLVAEAPDWKAATLLIDGPPCGGGATISEDSKADLPQIKIEIDSLMPASVYPHYFNVANSSFGFEQQAQYVGVDSGVVALYCGCRIRVFPRDGVTLTPMDCAVGVSPVGYGSQRHKEALQFSNSNNASLGYMPANKVSILSTSTTALNKFGKEVSVAFKTPGEWVTDVEWQDEHTYTLTGTGSRRVQPQEIVAVTSPGNETCPIYGFCAVDYTAEYAVYEVALAFDKKKGWYVPGMIMGTTADGRVATCTIEPPALDSVL